MTPAGRDDHGGGHLGNDVEDRQRGLSRRELLKLAASAATVPCAISVGLEVAGAAPVAPAVDAGQAAGVLRAPLQALTATEAELLDAIVARLIPTDAGGPGASEAGAVRYIDRALAGALVGSREAYRTGLAALDRYARSSRGAPFIQLPPTDQDSVLVDVETGSATGSSAGFQGGSARFFAMVRAHTLQGTFGDPYYGGNVNFVGWDLLGYPGVRTSVGPNDQRLGVVVAPTRRSAYDGGMFEKATVSVRMPGRAADGD